MYGCQVVKPITLMKSIEKEGTIANFKANVAALEFIAVKFAEEDCIKDLASLAKMLAKRKKKFEQFLLF